MAIEAENNLDNGRSSAWDKANAALIPVIFLLISLWICLEALQVPFGNFRMPGAGFFPLLLGMALGALSLAFLGMNLFGNMIGATPVGPARPEILYLMAALFASAWLFERAGYLLTMALFLGVTMKVLGRTRWPAAVAVALVGSVASYLLFGRVLMIALPAGILPF
jgi:putative tricarboxylic transport membrane protein